MGELVVWNKGMHAIRVFNDCRLSFDLVCHMEALASFLAAVWVVERPNYCTVCLNRWRSFFLRGQLVPLYENDSTEPFSHLQPSSDCVTIQLCVRL